MVLSNLQSQAAECGEMLYSLVNSTEMFSPYLSHQIINMVSCVGLV